MVDTLREFINLNQKSIFEKPQGVHLHPNISAKKMSGALSSYAKGIAASEIIVLLDDTVFGGAKEGLIISENYIFAKAIGNTPVSMSISDINNIEVIKRDIYINGRLFIKLSTIHALTVVRLMNLVLHFINNVKPKLQEENNQHSSSDNIEIKPQARQKVSEENITMDINNNPVEYVTNIFEITKRKYSRSLNDDELQQLFSDLVEKHADITVKSLAVLYKTAKSNKEYIELSKCIYIVLYAISVYKLPEDFKNGMDQAGAGHGLLSFAFLFMRSFNEAVSEFNPELIRPDEDLEMLTTVIFGTNTDVSDLPKNDLALLLFNKMGLPKTLGPQLISMSDKVAKNWYNNLLVTMASEL